MNLVALLRSVRAALRAIRHSELLGPRPLCSALLLLGCVLRCGASLYSIVVWNARRWPERTALQSVDGALTFLELRREAERIAGLLVQACPLQPSARRAAPVAGVLCRDPLAFVTVLLACGRLGWTALLLSPSLSPDEVRAACQTQDAALLICDHADTAAYTGSAAAASPAARWILDLSTLRGDAPAATHLRARWRWRRGGMILLTAGTTGTPKAIQRRPNLQMLAATAASLSALLAQLPLRAGAPTLLTLPLWHGHGLATLGLSLTLASPLHLLGAGRPQELWACLQAQRIEVLVLVPTVLYRLLAFGGAALSLRAIVCGSAPLSAELCVQAQRVFGEILYNLYGSTETGLISLAAPGLLAEAPGSVGRGLPGVMIEIRSDPAQVARVGEVGNVLMRGGLLLASARQPYDTGDLGYLDTRGRLFLVGRRDDLLVVGGEKIYPQVIEERIARTEYVRDCVVGALPSAEYGQAVQLWVVLETGHTRAELETELAKLLPKRLRPVLIHEVQEVPRTALGKLLRARLI
ncbi:class I adenylate-forming enzyme family protein [Deinococcus sp.]|uniref:class I adenylate-forming enzyme family protein n=1 Tax=Deinococcus sp. TaxID=47478 RepID=UPI003CC642A4